MECGDSSPLSFLCARFGVVKRKKAAINRRTPKTLASRKGGRSLERT
jgi:hypothetical protein